MKQPEAGEWWQRVKPWRDVHNIRFFVVGKTFDGKTLAMRRWIDPLEKIPGCDFIYATADGAEGIEHLPDCTGWDWEPEVFPQWYTSGERPWPGTAFVIRTSPSCYDCVGYDGKLQQTEQAWLPAHVEWVVKGKWKQVTQEQAEALIERLPATRKVLLKEWLCTDAGSSLLLWRSDKPAWFNDAMETGNTREIEVPA